MGTSVAVIMFIRSLHWFIKDFGPESKALPSKCRGANHSVDILIRTPIHNLLVKCQFESAFMTPIIRAGRQGTDFFPKITLYLR